MSWVIIGIICGCIGGWLFNFVKVWIQKGDLLWTWLLCKPWPLSESNRDRLMEYYL